MTEPEITLLVGVITLICTGILFPYMLYFFKKNERLHEETMKKVGEHGTTLTLHEYRLISLEEWRRLHQPSNPPQGTTQVTVN